MRKSGTSVARDTPSRLISGHALSFLAEPTLQSTIRFVDEEYIQNMDVLQAIHIRVDECLGKTSILPASLETPFSKFGTCASSQDLTLIDSIIAERNAQLFSLALQMASVDSAIQKLAAIRTKLEENSTRVRRSLQVHRAFIAPAARVPPEVLGEIFYHCLPKTPYNTPRDSEAPVVLTHVCHHWRAVALSTPHLWSSLSICLRKAACETYRHGSETWLARAKDVPLAVRVLNDIDILAADSMELSLVVMQWLRSIVDRCGDLWWHGPSLPTLFVPGSDTNTSTEIGLHLQRLRITTHRDTPSIYFPGPAAHLHSASLQCLNYDMQSLDGITLPWDNLVELKMHFALFSSTAFVHLISRCTRLCTLVASCLCADEDQLAALRTLPKGSLTHSTLRRIEIKVIRAGLDLLLGALTLPALEELDVCFCYRERDAWPHASFVDLVGRSRCSLRRLTVRSNRTAVPYFGEYREAMPGLAIYTAPRDPLSA